MTPERERAIEAAMRAHTPGASWGRVIAADIVDALLALPDPVRDAAREVVGANFPRDMLAAVDRLRAALEESET